MSVTAKLLRLHRVDQQIRGLRSRIDAAQKYLDEQERLLAAIKTKQDALAAQARQLQAAVHNDEAEMGALDARMAKLRDQLNSSQTNKEYSALLVEVNTHKVDRDKVEQRALESMSRLDEIKSAGEALTSEYAERAKIRDVARADRDRRAGEVKERLNELQAEREKAAADVPRDALAALDAAVRRHDDDAMAPIEEHSRRHMEYSCGACQVMLPIELVSSILGRGALTQCVSCGAILYMEDSLRESMTAGKR